MGVIWEGSYELRDAMDRADMILRDKDRRIEALEAALRDVMRADAGHYGKYPDDIAYGVSVALDKHKETISSIEGVDND